MIRYRWPLALGMSSLALLGCPSGRVAEDRPTQAEAESEVVAEPAAVPEATVSPEPEIPKEALHRSWRYVVEIRGDSMQWKDIVGVDLYDDGTFTSTMQRSLGGEIPSADGVIDFSTSSIMNQGGSWSLDGNELVLIADENQHKITFPGEIEFSLELSDEAKAQIENDPQVTEESIRNFRKEGLTRFVEARMQFDPELAKSRFIIEEFTGERIQTVLVDEATEQSAEERIPVVWEVR